MIQRLLTAIVTVLVTAIGIRVAAWVIEPILPAITVLLVLSLIALVVLGGPRSPK